LAVARFNASCLVVGQPSLVGDMLLQHSAFRRLRRNDVGACLPFGFAFLPAAFPFPFGGGD
jgi:hypothetical protein